MPPVSISNPPMRRVSRRWPAPGQRRHDRKEHHEHDQGRGHARPAVPPEHGENQPPDEVAHHSRAKRQTEQRPRPRSHPGERQPVGPAAGHEEPAEQHAGEHHQHDSPHGRVPEHHPTHQREVHLVTPALVAAEVEVTEVPGQSQGVRPWCCRLERRTDSGSSSAVW